MLTRPCGRCQGNGLEPHLDEEKPCIGCKGSGRVEVPEDPVKIFPPSNNEEPMAIDPAPDPEKKAARKRAMQPCGKCLCCRRWKSNSHLASKTARATIANAQKWASYWKAQYESLAAAKRKDQDHGV